MGKENGIIKTKQKVEWEVVNEIRDRKWNEKIEEQGTKKKYRVQMMKSSTKILF